MFRSTSKQVLRALSSSLRCGTESRAARHRAIESWEGPRWATIWSSGAWRTASSLSGIIPSAEYLQGCTQQPPHPLPHANGPARILDGRQVAAEWLAELRQSVEAVSMAINRAPKLRIIMVGSRPDSRVYVHRKLECCQTMGIDAEVHLIPCQATQEDLEESIRKANEDGDVDAILVQLPLAAHMDESGAMRMLHPDKDVDGFHPLNMGALMMKGRNTRLVPCTSLGCLELLRRSGISVQGKQVVVVGDSNIVGAPLSIGLLRENGAAAVTVCNRTAQRPVSEQQKGANGQGGCNDATAGPPMDGFAKLGFPLDLPEITRKADILVVAVGCEGLVRKEWVKPGAVILDIGINVKQKNSSSCDDGAGGDSLSSSRGARLSSRSGSATLNVVGDVALDEVSYVASAVTPVPGGIGPMTIAAVVHNTIQAAWFAHNSKHN